MLFFEIGINNLPQLPLVLQTPIKLYFMMVKNIFWELKKNCVLFVQSGCDNNRNIDRNML